MLTKIKWNGIHREEQVNAYLKEAKRMIAEYGWENETVMPYSFPVKITKLIDNLEHIWECTRGSQELVIAEVNGLARILNKWEEYELERRNGPQVTVRVLIGEYAGELRTFPESMAKAYVECGFVEAV